MVGIEPFPAWQERDRASLRTNGSLPLGLALRCAELIGGVNGREIEGLVAKTRRLLDSSTPAELPRARAVAGELCLAAATSLVIETGGRAVLSDSIAQLLARQAVFLLVFGQTPAIKSEQLRMRAGADERVAGCERPSASWWPLTSCPHARIRSGHSPREAEVMRLNGSPAALSPQGGEDR